MKTVLLIGSTGFVGNKVLKAVLAKGQYNVKVLVRKTGVLIEEKEGKVVAVVGDMMDRASLETACRDVNVVINTANGYMSGHPEIDTVGANNVVDACKACHVERLIYCSILTAESAKPVEHFYDKYQVETYMEEQNINYIALRPGAFIDQVDDYLGQSIRSNSPFCISTWDKNVPVGMILTDDLARYFADCIDLPESCRRLKIDVGLSKPVSMNEITKICNTVLKRNMYCIGVPKIIRALVRYTIGYWKPFVAEMLDMFAYFDTGIYINQVENQTKYLGVPPTPEFAIRKWIFDTLVVKTNHDDDPNPAASAAATAPSS